MKTTDDIFRYILDLFATLGECYGDICKYCKYDTRCMMMSISARDVLGGAY